MFGGKIELMTCYDQKGGKVTKVKFEMGELASNVCGCTG